MQRERSSDQDLSERVHLHDAGEGKKDKDEACSSKMASCRGCSGRVCPYPNWGWKVNGEQWGWNEAPPTVYVATPVEWPFEVPTSPMALEDLHPPSGNLSWRWGVDQEGTIALSPLGLGEDGASTKRKLGWGDGYHPN